MDALLGLGLILLSLSILVTIHELGHFWAAKFFKIKVEVFSLFFPPKIFSFKKGDTVYQLGSIPLGGYVKIAGMIDESLDKETLDKAKQKAEEEGKETVEVKKEDLEPKPWEFNSKPVWQRAIVMIGGIVMNILLAILIMSTVKFMYGDQFIEVSEIQENGIYVYDHSPGSEIGMKTGDKFVSLNGEVPISYEEASALTVLLGEDGFYEVERNGEVLKLAVPNTLLDSLSEYKKAGYSIFEIHLPPLVKVGENPDKPFPAEKAGMETGDLILAIQGKPIPTWYDMSDALKENKNKTIDVAVLRGVDTVALSVQLDSAGILGVNPAYEPKTGSVEYGFFGAIWQGTKASFGIIFTQVKAFKKMAQGDASVSKNLQGPIGIAIQLLQSFKAGGWKAFWVFTALISMILAFMNFLPIPALDGGHLVFLAYEGISGRPPSDKFKLVAQYIGMIFVLLLMVFVIFKDIIVNFF